jgi:hypothetical protein
MNKHAQEKIRGVGSERPFVIISKDRRGLRQLKFRMNPSAGCKIAGGATTLPISGFKKESRIAWRRGECAEFG